MNKPTEADLERAHATLLGEGTYEQRVAQALADVRAEEREASEKRAEAAEAKLVELVREVREWDRGPSMIEELMVIIAKYERGL